MQLKTFIVVGAIGAVGLWWWRRRRAGVTSAPLTDAAATLETSTGRTVRDHRGAG